MQVTSKAHLTYCSNIHPGESWKATFKNLKSHIPFVKKKISPESSFGIGLRLSNEASLELVEPSNLNEFKDWLQQNDCYVFTMNGFPYGGFHDQVVKDQVHAPDWTTSERLEYTQRLATILSDLLPAGITGGISTSPLTYRWWYPDSEHHQIKKNTADQLMKMVIFLNDLHQTSGRSIHLDIEPEPDGLLETGQEFINFYQDFLLDSNVDVLMKELDINRHNAANLIREHIQLCLDVCHYAVEFDPVSDLLEQHRKYDIPIGKIQISAALKADLSSDADRSEIQQDLKQFVEPNYLHQAVMKTGSGDLKRFRDLDQGLENLNGDFVEIRTHYHVPIFCESYGSLKSTQSEISDLLSAWRERPFCSHLEIETYTWSVLPDPLRKDLDDSIVREMDWVLNTLKK